MIVVLLILSIMYRPIQLSDQQLVNADKIHDESFDGMLTPELCTANLPITQPLPGRAHLRLALEPGASHAHEA